MKNLFRILMVAMLVVSSAACQSNAPELENTRNKEQEWFEDFFTKHTIFFTCQNDKVHFVSDGSFGPRAADGFTLDENFYVKIGDTFYKAPDHHASAEFTVVDINDERVVLKYKSSFDHRSFGPNLITTDTGEIELYYKKY